MKLAIVIPIYNEQENLPEVRRRITEACDKLDGLTWQVIYVDDGSTDESVRIILEQHRQDPRFTLLQLSRNFGLHPALSAGLAYADGDAVITMDGDLQDPPELIPELVASWRSGGQVVLAVRRSRQERGLRRLGFSTFYRLFGWLSDFPMPTNAGNFGLLDRQAVQALNRLIERNRYVHGLRCWIGFDRRTVFYDRQERLGGQPKQSFDRLIRLALDGIFGFSYLPLRLMTFVGILTSTVGFGLACVYVTKRLLDIETAPTGFTTIVTLILLLGGIQLIALGLLGEYLGRIYDEVKRRPLFIVKRCWGVNPAQRAVENSVIDS